MLFALGWPPWQTPRTKAAQGGARDTTLAGAGQEQIPCTARGLKKQPAIQYARVAHKAPFSSTGSRRIKSRPLDKVKRVRPLRPQVLIIRLVLRQRQHLIYDRHHLHLQPLFAADPQEALHAHTLIRKAEHPCGKITNRKR